MSQPLADRLRPTCLEEFVGQQHLIGVGKPLRSVLAAQKLHSMLLWGPPGVGKTTLARIIAHHSDRKLMTFSAVLSGIKEVKDAIQKIDTKMDGENHKAPILFIDEIHRFNKAQQDALLPFVEQGTVTLIGATTENPSFEVNNALLSRCRIYVLQSLLATDLSQLVQRVLTDPRTGLGDLKLSIEPAAEERLIMAADGDARSLLNILEITINKALETDTSCITEALLIEIISQDYRRFDKRGDVFYEQISALHKSVRGSSPDGALYWLSRMLDGGCDPLYVARRIIRIASEDVGNADPRGLTIALDAYKAFDILGSPEGELALAQAVVYLAVAPKSNAVYVGFNQAMQDIQAKPSLAVPMHLRNASTKMMKKLNYGKGYRYDHDQVGGVSKGQSYLPDELKEKIYYRPTQNGLEIKISEKLKHLREDAEHPIKKKEEEA